MRHKSCGHWNFNDSRLCEGCGQRLDDDYVVGAEQGRIRILSISEEEKRRRREEEKKRKIEEEKRRRDEEKEKKGGEVQSSDLSKQLRGVNLKLRSVIKPKTGEVTSPLPPPPQDRVKYKSQFRCKACGHSFWVYEHRLKIPYCQECGAPDPVYVATEKL